ncbi:YncE family protein [Amycolatopsis sp. PS_44_ISF1]|uniref:YncE family protein n=1 Tax=Amycolatopsis sp. PS_44_ISF1 TaxID=2974917 RepID=UPI0028DE82BC|nr:YncE family protein [Amycolatopsis sp. PS_44_ISF1]MDT8915305.1 YncE family protein [Amycolatopsis sp. PS_44_ISF1]
MAGLLIVDTEAGAVELRDTGTFERLAVRSLRSMPHEVVVDRQRGLGYISISYEDGFYGHYEKASHFVEVVSLDGLRPLRSIDLSPHWGPHGLQLSPDLRTLLITCESHGGELIALDLETDEVTGSVPVGAPGPHWLTLTPDGTKVFTANKEEPFVTVVDVASMTVTGRIETPCGTEGIAVSPDGAQVFVAGRRSPHLYLVDVAADRLTAALPLEEGPGAVAVTPDGRRVVFTSFNFDVWNENPVLRRGFVQVLELPSRELGPRIPVGRFPLNVTTSSEGGTAYVANYKDDTVSVVDLDEMTVTDTRPVGEGPHGLAYLDAPAGD